MGLAAIVVVETGIEDSSLAAPADTQNRADSWSSGTSSMRGNYGAFHAGAHHRAICACQCRRYQGADGGGHDAAYAAQPAGSIFDSVRFKSVSDVGSAIGQEIREFSQSGIDHSFIVSANVYAETDLRDLFYFHREARLKQLLDRLTRKAS